MNKHRPITQISILVIGIWLLVSLCYAEIPHLIGYQGRLTDTDGAPKEGSFSITFRIYDAEAGGSLLWDETHSNVTVTNGIFDVLLGSVTTLDLAFDAPYYLAIQVASDPEMTPRQRITSAGYAIRAETSERLETEHIINAEGGLVIETRTSDPSSPETGQIWLRTDL